MSFEHFHPLSRLDYEYRMPTRLTSEHYVMYGFDNDKKTAHMMMLSKEAAAWFVGHRHLFKITTRKPTISEIAGRKLTDTI